MSLLVIIKVVPSSGRSAWTLDKSGTLKCYLKSPAEKGLANKELIKKLAHDLDLTQADIDIIQGLTIRIKTLKIKSTLTLNQVLLKLGVKNGEQRAIF